jgi:hypothetical protein
VACPVVLPSVPVAVTVTVCCAATVAGAVYKPPLVIVPAPVAGVIVHVTAWFAVNCCVPPPYNDTVAGVAATGGSRVMAAAADFVPSAWLVAVTVTVRCALTVAGAVYNPAELIVPAPVTGLKVHVTAAFAAFVTVAVNCCVPPAYSVAIVGDTAILTGGDSVTVAVADFVMSAWLVAITFTFWVPLTVAGAVYKPVALIVPAPVAGLKVHVTAELPVFATLAVNCCV